MTNSRVAALLDEGWTEKQILQVQKLNSLIGKLFVGVECEVINVVLYQLTLVNAFVDKDPDWKQHVIETLADIIVKLQNAETIDDLKGTNNASQTKRHLDS